MSFGRPYILNIDGCIHDGWLVLSNYQSIYDKDFLYYVLSSNFAYSQFCDVVAGAVVKNLNTDKVSAALFPLPPLAEQKRIVAALEKMLPLVEEYGKKEEALTKLNADISSLAKKAVLQEAVQGKLVPQVASEGNARELLNEIEKSRHAELDSASVKNRSKTLDNRRKTLANKEQTDLFAPNGTHSKKAKTVRSEQIRLSIPDEARPFDIPQSWCWCRLGEICDKLIDGDHNPPAGISEKTEYIMASSRNINDDKLVDLNLVRYLTKEVFEKENERTRTEKGDIFFTSVGTLGRSCIFDGNLNICFQRSVSIIHTLIFNKYLKYCLDNPTIQYFIISNATGTAQKGFYLNQLQNLLIPLPPLAEQKRIVAALEKILPLCEKLGK